MTASRSGIHALNAMVTEGLNRDEIAPPQPCVSLTSNRSFFPSLLTQTILSVFLSLFSSATGILFLVKCPLSIPLHDVVLKAQKDTRVRVAAQSLATIFFPIGSHFVPRSCRHFLVQCSVTYHARHVAGGLSAILS